MKILFRIVAALAILFVGGKLIAWAMLPSAEEEARKLVTEMNAKAPMPIGGLGTLQRAEMAGEEIHMHLQLDARAASLLEGDEFRAGLLADTCKNPLWIKLNKDIGAKYLVSVEGRSEQARTVSVPRGVCKAV